MEIAHHNGIDAEQVVKDAVLRIVEEDTAVRTGIRRGVELANRGELIEHDEVKARLNRLLQPR